MNMKEIHHQSLIRSLIVFVAITIIAFEMPEKMPSSKRSFLSGGTTRFRHLGSANVVLQAQRYCNPSLWMASLIIHIAQPCFLSKEIQGERKNCNRWMPLDEYPCVANFSFN